MFFRRPTVRSRASSNPDGAAAERMAEAYLREQGLELLERNYTCRQGEIDLVMEDAKLLVFVEVRYRRSSRYGSAAETVTAAKQRKITLAAQNYLLSNPSLQHRAARFDILAMTPARSGYYHYNWLKHAFDGRE